MAAGRPVLGLCVGLQVLYEAGEEHGRREGRSKLGGDIMIHGGAASIGCLAMGDPATEDLFVLAAETGIKNISVILTPLDFRVRDLCKTADVILPTTARAANGDAHTVIRAQHVFA